MRAAHADCLDFTSKAWKRFYGGSYLAVVRHAPRLWAYLYEKSEGRPRRTPLVRLFDRLNYRRYLEALRASRADAIVCTHFLPYLAVSGRLREAGVRAPVFAVVTDFDPHPVWIDPLVDRYLVPHEESAWQLASKGAPPNRIETTGIPVLPEFGRSAPAGDARRSLGLAEEAFTVLVLSGGFGVGRIEEAVRHVAAALGADPSRSAALLVVCGRNEEARARLRPFCPPANVAFQVHGFVSDVDRFMAAADVLVSKSGGLTSAEALARGLPMIVLDPIPGQEEDNADFLAGHGAAVRALDLGNVEWKIRRVFAEPESLASMRAAARRLARPEAGAAVLAAVHAFLDGGGRGPVRAPRSAESPPGGAGSGGPPSALPP